MANTFRHKNRAKAKRGLLDWSEVHPRRSKGRLGSDIHIGCDHCWEAARRHDGNMLDERRAYRRNVRLSLHLGLEPPHAMYPGYQD